MNRSNFYIDSPIQTVNKSLINKNATIEKMFGPNDLYLPDGIAYKIAHNLRSTNSNQLRKFFSMIKEAEYYAKNSNLNSGKEKLYRIIPLAAYSVGRGLLDKDFFEFLKICIKPERINSLEDIMKFSTLFESIVAYYKEREAKKWIKQF